MREIWNGGLPFEGSEPIGPRPVKGRLPRILGGFAGPQAIAKSAQWADGLYAFSITGDAGEIRHKFEVFDRAWQEAGREGKPWKIGGFWYSLADDAEQRSGTTPTNTCGSRAIASRSRSPTA